MCLTESSNHISCQSLTLCPRSMFICKQNTLVPLVFKGHHHHGLVRDQMVLLVALDPQVGLQILDQYLLDLLHHRIYLSYQQVHASSRNSDVMLSISFLTLRTAQASKLVSTKEHNGDHGGT